jgi:hypothetical protein
MATLVFDYLAHFHVAIDGGDVQWTAAVVVDHVSPANDHRSAWLALLLLLLPALPQDPQDEILAAVQVVQWHGSFGAPQPEIHLILDQQPQRFRLPLGGAAIRRTDFKSGSTKNKKKQK